MIESIEKKWFSKSEIFVYFLKFCSPENKMIKIIELKNRNYLFIISPYFIFV